MQIEQTKAADYRAWFSDLQAAKCLDIEGDLVRCFIGFRRIVKSDIGSEIVSGEIYTEASSITEALRDAKFRYEFLTNDDPITIASEWVS